MTIFTKNLANFIVNFDLLLKNKKNPPSSYDLGVGSETAYPYAQQQTACRAVSPVEKNVQYTNLGTDDASIVDWVANKGPVGFGFL